MVPARMGSAPRMIPNRRRAVSWRVSAPRRGFNRPHCQPARAILSTWRRMNTDLTGKVALITGGGSGIGAATCRTLAQAGAAVAVVDLRPGPAQEVADAIAASGGRALALAADVTDEAAVSAAVRRTVEEFG